MRGLLKWLARSSDFTPFDFSFGALSNRCLCYATRNTGNLLKLVLAFLTFGQMIFFYNINNDVKIKYYHFMPSKLLLYCKKGRYYQLIYLTPELLFPKIWLIMAMAADVSLYTRCTDNLIVASKCNLCEIPFHNVYLKVIVKNDNVF